LLGETVMKRILISVALLLCLSARVKAVSNTIEISGILTDAGGQAWIGGTYSFNFIPGPGGSATDTGVDPVKGVFDGTGALDVAVVRNDYITPAGSKYIILVCPKATAPCFSSAPVTFTTGSATISDLIVPPAVSVNGSVNNQPAAYSDDEIAGPVVGFMYYNILDADVEVYDGTTFNVVGGGGGVPWQIATVSVSSAQLQSAASTPVTLLAAPGAGNYLSVLAADYSFHANTTPFGNVTLGPSISFGAVTDHIIWNTVNTDLTAGVDVVGVLGPGYIEQPTSTAVNAPLQLFNPQTAASIGAVVSTTLSPIASFIRTFAIANPGTGYANADGPVTLLNGAGATFIVVTVDGGGGALTLQLNAPGISQTAGTYGVTGGVGTGLTITTTVQTGSGVIATSLFTGGAGYTAGDAVQIAPNSGSPASFIVDTVDGGGAILTYHQVQPNGIGFIPDATHHVVTGGTGGDTARIVVTDTGSGLVNGDTFFLSTGNADAIGVVDSVDAKGNLLTYHLTAAGTGYGVGLTGLTPTTGISAGTELQITAISPVIPSEWTLGDGTYTFRFKYFIVAF
jgi:hypothetical protein